MVNTIAEVRPAKNPAVLGEGHWMAFDPDIFSPQNSSVWLSTGHHACPEEGLNIMECVAYVAGETHSSYPECACPVTGEVARLLADCCPEDSRQRLAKYILPLSFSHDTQAVMMRRMFYCVDYAVRRFAPAAFSWYGFPQEAESLQALEEIRDEQSALRVYYDLRRLFLNVLIDPRRVQLSMAFSHLEELTEAAARAMTAEGDAISVLQKLKATVVRFESCSQGVLGNRLFEQKRLMLENMLNFGPTKPVPADVLALRRQRLARLEKKMANGVFGREPGSEDDI